MNKLFQKFTKRFNSKLALAPLLISFLTLKQSNYSAKFKKNVLRQEPILTEDSNSVVTKNANERKLFIPSLKELAEGELREVKFGTGNYDSVVAINYKNKLYVLSNYCPHFGAPMHQGLLVDNLLKCPWHGASFDITSGRTEISPSIDDLVSYEIFTDSDTGKSYINLPKDNKDVKPKEVAHMVKRDEKNKTKYLILGGGPAALSAAETLRQNGFTGEITLISKDKHLPYDRTLISKFIPKSVDKAYLREPDFYKNYDIDINLNSEAISINQKEKKVKLNNGKEIEYDKLLLATGGDPLVPKIKGKDAEHVFTLRTFTDIESIAEKAKNSKNLVIVGSSFIGMEAASCLKKTFKNLNVTVVDPNPTPMANTLGQEIGSALQT